MSEEKRGTYFERTQSNLKNISVTMVFGFSALSLYLGSTMISTIDVRKNYQDPRNVKPCNETIIQTDSFINYQRYKINIFYKDDRMKMIQDQYYTQLNEAKKKFTSFETNFIKLSPDHSEVIDIGQFFEEDGRIHFFQFANQMVYFDNILEFLGAAQFEAFSLKFNLCFGKSTRDLASLFKLNETKVGDGSSEDCKSSILIQNIKKPFKQLDLGDELPFVELAMGYNHILQNEPKWTTKMAGKTVPKSFFAKSKHLWRPGIHTEPNRECNATIPVFIKTSADNLDFREILRKHFLKESFKGQTLAQYFVIGKTKNISDPKFLKVREEAEKYKDIIIGDFIDSYYNLTMKTFVAHQYASKRCHSAKWVVIHDDDAVIKWKYLVDKLNGNTIQYNFNCLYSSVIHEFPMRKGRNNVSPSVYPFAHRFPKFCHGPCVAMTFESSKRLFEVAMTHKWNHMPVEDVLFNGVMREIANMTNIEIQTGVCRHLTGARSNKLSDLNKLYSELNVNGKQKI